MNSEMSFKNRSGAVLHRSLLIHAACASLIMSIIPCVSLAERDAPLQFFCGAAVRVPMDEVIKNYERERGERVSVTYGGSGNLLSQMELARRGDLYLAGSPDYIIIGVRKGLLLKGTDRKVAYLIPSIIVPKGNPAGIRSLEDLSRKGVRIGMGNPETVCLGLYGVELLEHNGLLQRVLPNVVVFAKSCEDTAVLAVLKKVDAILGWDVFEAWNPKEVERVRIAPNQISRISYVAMAVPVYAADRKRSEAFMSYITGEAGRKVFKKWGYISEEAEARSQAPAASIGGEYHLPDLYFKLLRHEK